MKTGKIPGFASEEQEREFWASHDATEFIDFARAPTALFPNLKPSVKTVSIRLPASLLNAIRVMAHKRDVSCAALIKTLLAEAVERELGPLETGTRTAPRVKGKQEKLPQAGGREYKFDR